MHEGSPGEVSLQETIARHELEIAELRARVQALHDGHARAQLEAQIARRLAELEADIKLQEMQETLNEQPPKARRRILGIF